MRRRRRGRREKGKEEREVGMLPEMTELISWKPSEKQVNQLY